MHEPIQMAVNRGGAFERLVQYFSESGFMPHGHCYLWKPHLVTTHVISDLLIGLAYVSISISLYALVKKIKIPFSTMVLSFGVFIGACGWTHFNEIWNLWNSDYWYSGGIKALTAVASVSTGVWLVKIKPQIIALAEAARASQGHLKSLEESEKTIRSFYNSAPMMMGIVEITDNDILHISDNLTAARFFGKGPEELSNKWSSELGNSPERIGQWLKHYKKSQEIGRPVTFEYWHIAEGVKRFFSVTVSFISQSENQLPRFSYISQDMTEAKETLVKLKEAYDELENRVIEATAELKKEKDKLQISERKFASIFNNAPFAISLVKLTEGEIVDVNPAFVEIFGHSKDEVIGKNAGQLGLLQDLGTRKELRNEVEHKGIVRKYEGHFMSKTGKRLMISTNIDTLELEGEDYALVTLQDITEQRIAEKAFKDQLHLVKTITDNAASCLFMMDGKGFPTFMNPAAMKVTGYQSLEELNDRPLHYSIHWKKKDGSLYPISECPIEQARIERRSIHNEEEVFCRKDGTVFPVSYTVSSLQTVGENIGSVMEFRDITEQKRVEKELREAIRTRDEFLSIASHELKTPLTSLTLQTQTVKRLIEKKDLKVYSQERVDKLVNQTERQVQRLVRLVDDMLDITRIRTGKLIIKKEKFDLCTLINEVIERLHNQLENSGVQVHFESCEDSSGFWDKFRLEQVVMNLLTNAMKYGQSKPVHIQVWDYETYYLLSFKDLGLGIAKENQMRIFNRFERAISANEVSGLGLGLFITQQIILAHGGQIWVESEIGQGSNFLIKLPKDYPLEDDSVS